MKSLLKPPDYVYDAYKNRIHKGDYVTSIPAIFLYKVTKVEYEINRIDVTVEGIINYSSIRPTDFKQFQCQLPTDFVTVNKNWYS